MGVDDIPENREQVLTDRPKHLPINKRVGGRVDQFEFETPRLRNQADIKVSMGFHQCLTVVGFYPGIQNRQGTLTKQPVKTALAAVLQAIDFMIGENLNALVSPEGSLEILSNHEVNRLKDRSEGD